VEAFDGNEAKNAYHAFAYMAGHVTFLSRIPDAF